MTELDQDWQIANPPQLAQFLRVANSKVLSWIHSGELPAHNLATKPDSRPFYRIKRDDFDSFMASRASSGPRPDSKPARARQRKAAVPNFI